MADRGERRRRAITFALIAVLVSPAIRDHDSFPLSTYPMYAFVRPRLMTITTALGRDAAGAERELSMETIAATDDPLIAEQRVRIAVASSADGYCAQVAARAGDEIVDVIVVREVHDVLEVAEGRRHPESRIELARCDVR